MVKPAWLGEEWRQKEVRASEKGGGEKDRRTEGQKEEVRVSEKGGGEKDRRTEALISVLSVYVLHE